jgi:hypothetical protein
VVVAPRGCGKRLLASYIANKMQATYVRCGVKVDEVRAIIDSAYTARDKILYCMEDADTMRAEAKNAMLKVTEEPPKNAYFCMTVEDDSSLLDTIKSRANVIHLEPYTEIELQEYAKKYDKVIPNLSAAMSPYEVDMLYKYGEEFVNYVNLVIDNIAEVQPANAFKSGGKLALKNEEDKYDLKLFFGLFMNLCVERLMKDPLKYATGIEITSSYYNKVGMLGVNKQQLYDMWVFDLRGVW